MFGTSKEKKLSRLEALVRREESLNAFSQLAKNLGSAPKKKPSVVNAAICLDTCVLIKLATHPHAEAILDYFATRHKGVLVVSAQSLQEFWNNHIFAVETVSAGIARKFSELEKEVLKVDKSWSNFSDEITNLLHRLKDNFGHLHDAKLRSRLFDFSNQIAARAFLSEVPRSRFHPYAEQRKKLKTPPGFEDEGYGDFFIWLDFLFGIRMTESRLGSESIAVMVTDDKKKDWSKGGVPHPVLAAEMEDYAGRQLETWTLQRLWEQIAAEVGDVADVATADFDPH